MVTRTTVGGPRGSVVVSSPAESARVATSVCSSVATRAASGAGRRLGVRGIGCCAARAARRGGA